MSRNNPIASSTIPTTCINRGPTDLSSASTRSGNTANARPSNIIALATMIILQNAELLDPVPKAGMALFLIAWGIFTAYATVASFRTSVGVAAIFVTLTVLFFLLAWGEYNHTVKVVAGYEGIVCAAIAWYCSAAVLINNTFGKDIVPLGHIGPVKA